MDLVRILRKEIVLAILLFFAFPQFSNARLLNRDETKLTEGILSSLHDKNNDVVSVHCNTENCIYIAITQRTCLGCYTALEKYIRLHYKGCTINFIILMEEEPLLIMDKIHMISRYYKTFDNVYFYYYESDKIGSYPNFIQQLINSPSPYFFETNKKNNRIDYKDFSETNSLIYPNN